MSWSPSDAETPGASNAEPDVVELTLPELGTAPSATIVNWSKRIGDWVESDERICRLAVGELQFDVHSTAEGKLRRVFATVGARVVSGDSLAEVGLVAAQPLEPEQAAPDAGDVPSPAAAGEEPVATPDPFYITEPPAPLAEPELDPEPEQDAAAELPVMAPVAEVAYERAAAADDGAGSAGSGQAVDWASWHSPVVRKLAEKHGIDLSTVTGTGTGGRIRKRDVLDRI